MRGHVQCGTQHVKALEVEQDFAGWEGASGLGGCRVGGCGENEQEKKEKTIHVRGLDRVRNKAEVASICEIKQKAAVDGKGLIEPEAKKPGEGSEVDFFTSALPVFLRATFSNQLLTA